MKYSEEVEVVMRPARRQPTVVASPSQMWRRSRLPSSSSSCSSCASWWLRQKRGVYIPTAPKAELTSKTRTVRFLAKEKSNSSDFSLFFFCFSFEFTGFTFSFWYLI